MEQVVEIINQILAYRFAQAILLILSSLIIAKGIDLLVKNFLIQLTQKTATTVDDELVGILHRPVFSTVVLMGLSVSIAYFDLPSLYAGILHSLILTIAVFIWAFAIINVSDVALRRFSHISRRISWLDQSTLPLFTNVSRLIIVGLAVYFLFIGWGIDATAWLASAGIIGIALGLAAKDSLANLFGGLFVMADAPYKVGDFIVFDTGERGMVTKIGLRSTRILTRDDVEITIPNSITANSKIVNESGGPWEKERVRATIGVAYGSNLEQVRSVLLEAALDVDLFVETPEPRVRFREFGDSSLVFQVMGWISEPALRGQTIDELNEKIYNRLNQEGIEIPFPQRVLQFKPGLIDVDKAEN
jgi:small-conductance mechanosensitive channel